MISILDNMDAENTEQMEHRVTLEDDAAPSEAVVQAIAQAKGIDPLEMPSLYEIMDPEALDAVLKRGSISYIQFPFCGYTVIVVADGRILVQNCETNEN